MAIVEKDIALTSIDGSGNTVLYNPYTTVNMVDGAVSSINNITPDSNGNVTISTIGSATTITDTLPISKGGTGKTNGTDATNYLLNELSTGSNIPQDNDYYISQYTGGGNTTTTYHRRPISKLWEYIKSKISTVLGLTATQYGGNSATATKANSADSVDWTNVKNKPTTFAPSSHTQSASTITGLSTVATSGSYNDLTNKPNITDSIPIANESNKGLMSVEQVKKLNKVSKTGGNAPAWR